MSVSVFAGEVEGLAVSSIIECGCGEFRSSAFASHAEAYSAMTSGSVVTACGDDYCLALGTLFVVPEVSEPEVQMSNLNASEVFPLLGIDLEESYWCGSMSADDFKGRVLLALALAPEDMGREAEPMGHAVLGIGIRAPREVGYTQARLAKMLEVADLALARGTEVCWG